MTQSLPDNYKCVWTLRTSQVVAIIRNFDADGREIRQIPVVHDDAELARVGMRLLAGRWSSDGPMIYLTTAYLKLSRNIREAGIWHEVGHIHLNHFRDGRIRNQEQLRKRRTGLVEQGKVLREEAEADAFAVRRVGKEPMISFLNLLIASRPTGTKGSLNETGRRELELRVETVRNSTY